MTRKKWVYCSFLISLSILVISILWITRSFIPVAYEFIPGDRFIYDIELNGEVFADLSILLDDLDSPNHNHPTTITPFSQAYQVYIRAQLLLSTLQNENSHIHVSYRLYNPSLRLIMNERHNRYQAELSAKNLSKEIHADISSRGRIIAVYLDPEMDRFSKNLARYILAETQFVSPGGIFRLRNSWEAKEQNPNGEYIAKYESIDHPEDQESLKNLPDLKSFRKTKLSYSDSGPEMKFTRFVPNKSRIATGNLVAFFNIRRGYLETMSGSYSESVIIGNKEVSQSGNFILLRLLKKEILSPSELSHLQTQDKARRANVSPLPLPISISEEEAIRLIDRSTLASGTIDSLLAELNESEKKGDERNTSLFLKFKALVNLQPEVCETLTNQLITASPNSLTRHVISEAFAVSGHTEAQAALVQALRSKAIDVEFQLELIQKLSMVEHPTKLAESTLYEFAADINSEALAGNAIAGLGVMAYNLARYDSSRSQKIVEWMIEQIKPSTHEQNLNLYLMALGNSGLPQALKTFSKYSRHESLSIRSTVAAGLRWIENEGADDLLSKILEKDTESSVRNTAVFALSFRIPNKKTIEAQKKALMKDSSALVRLSILKNIDNSNEAFHGIDQLLRQVSEKDSSEEVRKTAAEILTRITQENSKGS